MKLLVALIVLAAAPALAQDAPAVACPVSGPCVSVLAGGLASLGGGTDTAVSPLARIAVSVPIADARLAPRLHATVDLTALPGETLDGLDPATYRALEFRVGLSQRLSARIHAALYAEAGFASRLPGDPEPRDKAARWVSGGIRFDTFGRGWLALGVGMDQRPGTGATYQPAVAVSGGLRLYEREGGTLDGASVQLLGEAVLGLQWRGYDGGRADVVRVGMAVGR